MKIRNLFMVVGFAAGMSAMSLSPSYAQSSDTVQEVQNQSFFKKKYRIKGSWSLEQRDGNFVIKFSESFSTKNGPDLKVFLSPLSASSLSGRNALNGALKLGVLKTNKGGQEYVIPAGADLSQFSSVIVHCEAYSVLWGGGSL